MKYLAALFVSTLVYISLAQHSDSEFQDMEKRKSAYMRFGRSDPEMIDMEKRKSAYMRFGKRSSPDLAVAMPEEYDLEAAGDVDKRKIAFMRFGKRKSAYMRLV
ncbi:hypothetical protein WR25_19282 isoform D [Diploscapter pachys]|uniref:Uncharacterized protein n=1 Tax=Diploscapter pachys TaxID=2018661 RepID=A0A2A2LAN7_9BILA|nr:hypothetical protein WR25_19282 isoform D [Diploscapter pachys]